MRTLHCSQCCCPDNTANFMRSVVGQLYRAWASRRCYSILMSAIDKGKRLFRARTYRSARWCVQVSIYQKSLDSTGIAVKVNGQSIARDCCKRRCYRVMEQKPVNNACQLTETEKEYVATNLNENDEVRQKAIDEVRRWITDNGNLCARTDDFSILRFLRSCKFDVAKTKRKLINYHAQRANSPEWYSKRDPCLPELQELFDLGVFLPLRELDDESRMVIIVRACVHDPSRHKQADVLKAGKMILDIATRNNETVSIHGVITVFDMTGVTLGHGIQMTPSIIQRLVHSWQACYPLRILTMNFVNAPIYVNVVLNVFRYFMTRKMRARLRVHTRGTEDFFKTIPSRILPTEYGGTAGTLKNLIEYWKNEVVENREWFADDEKYRLIA